MHAFLTFLFASFRDWLNTVRDYIDDWLGGGGCTPTTPTGETINVTDQDGLFSGGDNNDTITATRDIAGATFYLDTSDFYDEDDFFSLNGTWRGPGWQWDPSDGPYPGTGVLAGLTALQGGAGNDSITGTGGGIDIDGGAGNDTISGHSTIPGGNTWGAASHIFARGGAGDDSITLTGTAGVARGGDGNDTLTITGTNMNVSGNAGDDRLTLSGSGLNVIASAGADRVDVTNLTNSRIELDADDTLIRSDVSDGLRFFLGVGTSFTGNASNETMASMGGVGIDAAGGNDILGLEEWATLSSTLRGGAGDDTISGNYTDTFPWAHELYTHAMHVGRTDDVLDGGAGNDYIVFDLADTVTGGAGIDRLDGFASMSRTSHVTGFDPDEDTLMINLDPTTCTAADGNFATGDVTWIRQGNVTTIRVDGHDVTVIESVDPLVIGFQIEGNGLPTPWDDYPPHYVDINGNVVAEADLDVIVNRFENYFT